MDKVELFKGKELLNALLEALTQIKKKPVFAILTAQKSQNAPHWPFRPGDDMRRFMRSLKRATSAIAVGGFTRCPNDRDWRRWGDDRQGNILRRIPILIAFICLLTLQKRDLECNICVLTLYNRATAKSQEAHERTTSSL